MGPKAGARPRGEGGPKGGALTQLVVDILAYTARGQAASHLTGSLRNAEQKPEKYANSRFRLPPFLNTSISPLHFWSTEKLFTDF